MAGKRSSFARHAFHEVAISANRVDFEIKNIEARFVEICTEPLAGNSHSNAIARALPKRACSRFHAGSDVRFRVARSFAADLAEALDFVHGNGKRVQNFAVFGGLFDAREMQRGVEKHGSMACG